MPHDKTISYGVFTLLTPLFFILSIKPLNLHVFLTDHQHLVLTPVL